VDAGLELPEEFGIVFADQTRFASLGAWLQEGYAGSVPNLLERGKPVRNSASTLSRGRPLPERDRSTGRIAPDLEEQAANVREGER